MWLQENPFKNYPKDRARCLNIFMKFDALVENIIQGPWNKAETKLRSIENVLGPLPVEVSEEQIADLADFLVDKGFKASLTYGGRFSEPMLGYFNPRPSPNPLITKLVEETGLYLGAHIPSRRKNGYLVKQYVFAQRD